MRLINVPMRAVSRLPFAAPLRGALMLVSLTGRKTGRHYEQPVIYDQDGDALLTPGGGNWKPMRGRLQPLPKFSGDKVSLDGARYVVTGARLPAADPADPSAEPTGSPNLFRLPE